MKLQKVRFSMECEVSVVDIPMEFSRIATAVLDGVAAPLVLALDRFHEANPQHRARLAMQLVVDGPGPACAHYDDLVGRDWSPECGAVPLYEMASAGILPSEADPSLFFGISRVSRDRQIAQNAATKAREELEHLVGRVPDPILADVQKHLDLAIREEIRVELRDWAEELEERIEARDSQKKAK